MKGSVAVTIKDKRNFYSFELRRNITVLSGESGRGKTTLYEMVADYNRYGKASGIKISCDKNIVAIDGKEWQEKIEQLNNTIIIIDEDNDFIKTYEFAKAIQGNDNYFLLITRAYLSQLPISVTEIYEITGNKNKRFKRLYADVDYLYHKPNLPFLPFKPQIVITEDSGAGYQFFEAACIEGIECVSADGKSNIIRKVVQFKGKKLLVIADGAAFGSEIADLVKYQSLSAKQVVLFLPESFEWLVLKSGVIEISEINKIEMPNRYIDSKEYSSWERYFTTLLINETKDVKYQKYPQNKGKLPEFYIHENSMQKVKNTMRGINI